jgi:hypothetical protein
MLIEFRDNNSLHNDLFLHFENQVIECDSYYFALDKNIEPDKENAAKIKTVIKELLNQWKLYVSRAKSGEIVYLPFDFSDKYTGCLKCEFQSDCVLLTIGYLQFEGWLFFPSDISTYVKSNKLFIKSKDSIAKLKRSEFLNQIKQNIELIK